MGLTDIIKTVISNKDEFKHYAKNLSDFIRMKNDVFASQELLFQEILHTIKDTDYYKENNLDSTWGLDELKDGNKFPVLTNKKLHHIVEGIREGEISENYFTPYALKAFASSSGTQGIPKLIPVTEKHIEDYRKQFPAWMLLQKGDIRKLLSGRTLFYPAMPYKNKEGEIPIVNISGFDAINMPSFVRDKDLIHESIWDIKDEFQRNFEIAYKTLLAEDIVHIGFASAMVPYGQWVFTKENREKLIERMREEGHVERADYLDSLDKNFYIDDVFPDVFRISTMKSRKNEQALNLYSGLFRNFDKVEIVESGVNASEGRLTYGLRGEGNPGLPAFNVNIFMFLERQKDGKFSGERKRLDELEEGKDYKMLVLSHSLPALWDTDDIYGVKGKYGEVPILHHLSKDKYVNIAEEHTSEEDIISAVDYAFGEKGIPQKDYFLRQYVDENNGKKGYEFLFEEDEGYKGEIKDIAALIQEYLETNVLTFYEVSHQHGSGGTFGLVKIALLKKGTVASYDMEMSKDTQYKHKTIQVDDISFGDNFKIVERYDISDDDLKEITERAYTSLHSQGLIE